jgi:PAS domain S-box-containing protein
VIAAVRNVTEQRALQQSQENEVRLQELTDSVDTVFLLVNLRPPKYLYVSSNAERILGVAIPGRFKAADWTKFVHVEEQEAMRRDFYAPARAGRPATAGHRLVSPAGAVRWFRLVANPVSNPEGRPERTVITIEDITMRVMATKALRAAELLARKAEVAARLAEAEARTANDAKNQFLSRMSHELRTPLNAVLGFGQLLARHLANTEHAEAVGHILKGGRHLLNLINDVLDIARIESGDMTFSREPVPVPELIGETLQLMEPLAADANVTLTRLAGPPAEYVLADRQRLRQILLNLIANAIKYNRSGGNVWVGWETVDDHASLTVRDDGQGISLELQSRLFTPFDRLGAEGTAVEGTGIGLALTRALVELMAGTITAESAPGKGSCFTVSLPRSVQPTALQLESSMGDTGEADLMLRRSALLLYIEDNEPNVDVVEHIIRLRPDWRLIHAGLGQLGIDLARAHHPDLILLDLHLPDLPGRDVLTHLKNHPETSEAPVAILTADASSGQPRRLLDAGAFRFMTKPLDLDELLGLLDEVTARRDAQF